MSQTTGDEGSGMNAKAEQKARSHQAILDSAGEMLRQRGIAGASVAEIMKGAGLTVGGFYAHFTSKQDLMDETVRRTVGASWERLLSGVETLPEAERLERLLRGYLSKTHRDRKAEGCPFPAIVGEIATDAPELRGALADSTEPVVQRIAELLPEVDGPSDARLLAVGLLALMYGGLSLSRAVQGSPLSDDILEACRRLAELAVRQAEEDS